MLQIALDAFALPLRAIPTGTFVHAVELKPGKGAQMARGAGTQCQLMAKEGKFALLKLPFWIQYQREVIQGRPYFDPDAPTWRAAPEPVPVSADEADEPAAAA